MFSEGINICFKIIKMEYYVGNMQVCTQDVQISGAFVRTIIEPSEIIRFTCKENPTPKYWF